MTQKWFQVMGQGKLLKEFVTRPTCFGLIEMADLILAAVVSLPEMQFVKLALLIADAFESLV